MKFLSYSITLILIGLGSANQQVDTNEEVAKSHEFEPRGVKKKPAPFGVWGGPRTIKEKKVEEDSPCVKKTKKEVNFCKSKCGLCKSFIFIKRAN